MKDCGCKCPRTNYCTERFPWWPFDSFLTGCLAGLFLLILVFYSLVYKVRIARGAVVADGYLCAEIGGKILEKGGTAVDAAIASDFCMGVAMPHACGIGGGFFMTIFTHKNGYAEALNAREPAPIKSLKHMFPEKRKARYGPLSVAIPSEIRGLAAAHKKYGMLPWEELIEPSIEMCKNGIYVSEQLADNFRINANVIKKDIGLRGVFINPAHGEPYKKGELLKFPLLAKTLQIIATEGPDALYTGSLVDNFIKDINGIVTHEDMLHYAPSWDEPHMSTLFNGESLFTPPLPSGGVLITYIFNILNGFINNNIKSLRNWQRIVESFKHAYAARSRMGDDSYVMPGMIKNLTSANHAKDIRKQIFDDRTCQRPESYGSHSPGRFGKGTCNLCVLAPNGDSVVLTTSLKLSFGAGFISQSTGIILNAHMYDFTRPCNNDLDIPASPANFIEPRKIPLSSLAPTIMIDLDRSRQLLISGAGGPRVATSLVQIILKIIWFNMTLEAAINSPRIHHQLHPMKLFIEEELEKQNKALVTGFRQIGHEIEYMTKKASIVSAIYKDYDKIYAVTDPRSPGSIYYVYM